jgi:hypothetical protein
MTVTNLANTNLISEAPRLSFTEPRGVFGGSSCASSGHSAFDHGSHFIRDVVDMLDIEHVVALPKKNPAAGRGLKMADHSIAAADHSIAAAEHSRAMDHSIGGDGP